MAEAESREVLFRVGNRDIVKNGLYAILGPGTSRKMATHYDPNTNKSTWVSPKSNTFYASGGGLMAVVIDASLFEDAFSTPRPIIHFKGGPIEFDFQ